MIKISERTEVILTLICMILIGLFFGAVLFGWAAGCGEHYIDSKGQTHYTECFKREQR
jgi:hypothetical protein